MSASAPSTAASDGPASKPANPPAAPFRCRCSYASFSLPSPPVPLAGSQIWSDQAQSTPDLPLLPMHAAPLRIEIQFRLNRKYRRGDVGSFLSAMRGLQVEWHYLFGWKVDVITPPAAVAIDQKQSDTSSMSSSETVSTAAPTMRLYLWTNPSLPSNMQLVGAQRLMLARLPPHISTAFGTREIPDLIRAAVHSAYIAAGVPVVHDAIQPEQQSDVRTKEVEFKGETLAQVLGNLQLFLQSSSAAEIEKAFGSLNIKGASSTASSSTGAPAGTGSANPSPIAAAVSSSSDGPSFAPLPPVQPLRLDWRQPLFTQGARGLCAVLSLVKKSMAEVMTMEIQRQDMDESGIPQHQRYLKCEFEGLDFPALYAFFQHKLPTTAGSSSSEASSYTPVVTAVASAPASTISSCLAALLPLVELLQWLGLVSPADGDTPAAGASTK